MVPAQTVTVEAAFYDSDDDVGTAPAADDDVALATDASTDETQCRWSTVQARQLLRRTPRFFGCRRRSHAGTSRRCARRNAVFDFPRDGQRVSNESN